MRVLMIVQELNDSSWLRGFIVDWVRALARQAQFVHVLTLELGTVTDLPANVAVRSMGKERGKNRPRELFNFYRHVGAVIHDVDVIFSHMTPRYVWLAAPLAIVFRKSQMLWFIHPKDSRELRWAVRFSTWIVTATESSFPFPSAKVHPMGHGIDPHKFSPDPAVPLAEPPLILSIGRVTPIKNHATFIEIAAYFGARSAIDAQFAVVGGPATAQDNAHLAELEAAVQQRGIFGERFRFLGQVSSDELVHLLREASAVISLTPDGSFDKAALEALLTATPLLTSNPAFDDLLGDYRVHLRPEKPTPAQMVAALEELLAWPLAERLALGEMLRQRTAQLHSLDALMARLVALMDAR